MVTEPRTIDEITAALETELQAEIDSLTNFSGSFNESFLQAYAEQIREAEIKSLAAELAGVVEYAGKDLTEGDLDQLGVETVTPAEVNTYMQREHLDLLARNFGQQRGAGSRATTRLEFEVATDAVEIEEGTVVSNSLQSSGDQVDFIVDVDGDGEITTDPAPTISPPAGETTVTVDAVAAAVGTEYNVGINTLTKIPIPQPGVQSVRNIEAGRGGENEQSNAELRSDIRNAFFSASDGGTERGIINAIVTNTSDEVDSVGINEFTQFDPPFVDVVVDGGDDSQLRELIADAKPPGIEYNLERPVAVSIGIIGSTVVDGSVDDAAIETLVDEELESYSVGENIYRSDILQYIFNTNASILSGPTLNTSFTKVLRDQYTYTTGQDTYELSYAPFGVVKNEEYVVTEQQDTYPLEFSKIETGTVTVSVTDADNDTVLSDSEYQIVDSTGDGQRDAITIDGSAFAPPRSVLSINYQHTDWELIEVVSDSGTTYTQGTDFELIDTDGDGAVESLQWITDGMAPGDNERFFVSYRPARSFNTDVSAGDITIFRLAERGTTIDTYVSN